MQSADELREEARCCLDAIKDTTDLAIKRELATGSFELGQQAEASSSRPSIADELWNAGGRQI
jgi:hypothetical protein